MILVIEDNMSKDRAAEDALNRFFGKVQTDKNCVDLKWFINKSKVVGINNAARERHDRDDYEFTLKISSDEFRQEVMDEMMIQEGISAIAAFNRTSTPAKLSQEALKLDLL